jgi:spore coat polysaccharide biosynthesis protein SpsF
MSNTKEFLAIVLARANSTRLPGKMLLSMGEDTILDRVIRSAKRIPGVNKIVLATSERLEDDIFSTIADKHDVAFFRGSENDVVKRMTGAWQAVAPESRFIIRICADNPLFDPALVESACNELIDTKADIITPAEFPTLPFGLSQVVMTSDCLKRIDADSRLLTHREHVENFCFDNQQNFKIRYQTAKMEHHLPELILTLDYPEDYQRIRFWDTVLKYSDSATPSRDLLKQVATCQIALGDTKENRFDKLQKQIFSLTGLMPFYFEKANEAAAQADADLCISINKPDLNRIKTKRGALWVKQCPGPVGLEYFHKNMGKAYSVFDLPGCGYSPDAYLNFVLPALLNRMICSFPPQAGRHQINLSCKTKIAKGVRRAGFRSYEETLFPSKIQTGKDQSYLSKFKKEIEFWETIRTSSIICKRKKNDPPINNPFIGVNFEGNNTVHWYNEQDQVTGEMEVESDAASIAQIWCSKQIQQDRSIIMNLKQSTFQ